MTALHGFEQTRQRRIDELERRLRRSQFPVEDE